ncbi:hypothetical protein KSD_57450 [Ktedonobacter sp. SOSP1-85]|nr:hypothetical protein KSD_57450 [Ktedonobacter sp. SOSP1-85]
MEEGKYERQYGAQDKGRKEGAKQGHLERHGRLPHTVFAGVVR